MSDFNLTNVDEITDLVNRSLEKAVESFSSVVGGQIQFKSKNINCISITSQPCFTKKEDEMLFVLKTEIKGDLGGVCYLVFDQREVSRLWDLLIPESIRKDADKANEMGEALLLEVDNIIAASVVTQFANELEKKVFGYVPELKKISSSELNQLLNSKSRDQHLFLSFNASFQTEEKEFQPEFIWLLDDEFVMALSKIVAK